MGHYLVMIVFSAWILLPLVWALSLSLKTPTDIVNIPDKLFFTPTFENYFSVLREGEFVHQFSNSLIIGICSTILSLIIGVPAAYTLARFKFRASDNLQFWILSTRMAPPVAVLIPYFIVFQKLHMVDTYPAIIIMHLSVNLVLAIWLMRGVFCRHTRRNQRGGFGGRLYLLGSVLPHQPAAGYRRHRSHNDSVIHVLVERVDVCPDAFGHHSENGAGGCI